MGGAKFHTLPGIVVLADSISYFQGEIQPFAIPHPLRSRFTLGDSHGAAGHGSSNRLVPTNSHANDVEVDCTVIPFQTNQIIDSA